MASITQNIKNQAQNIAQNATQAAVDSIPASITTTANVMANAVDTIGATADKIAGAVDNLSENAATAASALATGGTYTGGPIENKLSKFVSYNYVFTFGPLTNDEINNPDNTYRKNGPSTIVLKTGGTGMNQVKTLQEQVKGITTEYFIDNVEINSLITPNSKTRQTNATQLQFEVLEPYSMGQFLQTLQVACIKAGHRNYLEAPFLLQVEFIGWDDSGNFVKIPETKRMFPLKLSNTSFNVSEQGSTYSVSAIPWNEQAFSDEIQEVKADIDIEGETLIEMLQTGPMSLAVQLNTREVEHEQVKNKETGDQYVILFPTKRSTAEEQLAGAAEDNAGATTQSSAGQNAGGIKDLTEKQKQDLYETLTGIEHGEVPADFDAELSKILGLVVRRTALGETIREYAEKPENVNDIGKSKIAKSYLDSGKTYFGKPAFVQDEENPGVFKRKDIVISNEAKKIQFPKGTKIQTIIEELVLLSEYGRKFITENPDDKGMKKWFKIETDVYNVTDAANVEKTGRSPKVYVYRIMPYSVQSSKIAAPTQVPPGYNELKKQALKEYNYIYTGKNDDIINFDIQLNAAFMASVQSDFGQLHADQVNAGRDKPGAPLESFTAGAQDGRNINSSTGLIQSGTTTKTESGGVGSGVEVHPETQIARSFNDAIVNSDTDLVAIEFEIWGDPYYIADSGMGNYNASERSGMINMTEDGAMDYQSSEVDIIVNFRTPIDIGSNGFMDFPDGGTKTVGAFSGLYQVTEVRNKFSGGLFSQELKTLRRRNQESDTGGAQPLSDSIGIAEKGAAGKISPLPDQTVGAFIPPGFDPSAGSLGGLNGILAQGSALSNIASDLSGAADGLLGNLSKFQSAVDGITKGKLPAGITDIAKNVDNNPNAGKVWDDNLGDYI